MNSPILIRPGSRLHAALFLAGVMSLILTRITHGQTCPPETAASGETFSFGSYVTARTACTDQCNANGHCCTLASGGCNAVPCTTGCHIAFFSADLAACLEECDVANAGECEYSHPRHVDIAPLGYSPFWEGPGPDAVFVDKCWGSEACGCPTDDDFGLDCSDTACAAGCAIANDVSLQDLFFNGLDIPLDNRADLDGSDMLAAMQSLSDHLDGTTVLTDAELVSTQATFEANQDLLPTTLTLLETALDLIDTYEAIEGPLFLNDATEGGFERESNSDNLQIHRTMLVVHQAVLDQIYSGTLYDNWSGNRPYDPIITDCASTLQGRKWLTSAYFPGALDPPSDDSVIHTISVDATKAECWGMPTAYCKTPSIKPLALYLAPGEVATVTVPAAMVGQGFKIQVGASVINNDNKDYHFRMDRITSTYDIELTETFAVANPLGGGLYLSVPYLADLGVVTISITGGVLPAPIFYRTASKYSTQAEWDAARSSLAPWADFVTDNFLMTLPRIWVYNFDFDHIDTLMESYDVCMEGVDELLGYVGQRNEYVLYLSADLHIRASAFGIGYPQVNDIVYAGDSGIEAEGPEGQSEHWTVNHPDILADVAYHELGHEQVLSYYRGETEVIVHLLYTYAYNVKIGQDLDEAFMFSSSGVGFYTVDAAAIHWMITENFRNGNEMDYSNTEEDELRYQHRGHGKYADIARLFGWEVLENFYLQENLDYNADPDNFVLREQYFEDVDLRTLKMSIQAGVDLTPLIHFWGIHPYDADTLKANMEANGLFPPASIRELLERYSTIIPMDQAAFLEHFEEVWPGQKDQDCASDLYGCGWYNVEYPNWTTAKATAAIDQINSIIVLYYGSTTTAPTTSNPSVSPTTPLPTPTEVSFTQISVRNQQFERDSNAWKIKLGNPVRECNTGNERSGDCCYAFIGSGTTEKHRIESKIKDFEGGGQIGDTFKLFFWLKGEDLARKGDFKAFLKFKGSNGTSREACKSSRSGTFSYEEMECIFESPISFDKMFLMFEYGGSDGRVYLDRLSLFQAIGGR